MKRIITIILSFVLVLSLGTTAFAGSNDFATTNLKGKAIKTFDESVFIGMNISYTDSGAPIVDDSNATIDNIVQGKGVVIAHTIYNTWMYSDRRFNNALFIIPAGMAVIVLQTDTSYASTQITYAGVTGWVQTSSLSLG